LLDVSNSMDGLIDQAKAQLWNMVTVMGKAECAQGRVDLQIALYEYGRSSNDASKGYVKMISPFTNDLDQLSKTLFDLKTNGGDEYCGQVILTSLDELQWTTMPGDYKVIFIAGNEDFLQGKTSYTEACARAQQKGVIVNTIYCGDRAAGLREHWNLGSECGAGSFTVIDQNAKVQDIPTPYDSALFVLNDKLNHTYIAYGYSGAGRLAMQQEMDSKNKMLSKSAAAQRVVVKGQAGLYRNDEWDLVDASQSDTSLYRKVEKKTLPKEFQDKTAAELKQIVSEKAKERSRLQQNIADLSAKRQVYVVEERNKRAAGNATATLESEIEKIIKQQGKRFQFTFK